MRWPSASLVASSVALAGCGASSAPPKPPPPPRIPAAVARQLAADADAVAAAEGCAAREPATRLQTDAIRLIARVPGRYQEPLMSSISDLVARIPECLPPKEEKHHPGKGHGHHKHGKGHD
jgi:hypothetical protein